MVRYLFLAVSFQLLDGIIQEEIYQHGIDFGIRILPKYLTSNLLDAPNTAA